ncbi:MAG: hypothetical protein R2762_09845 [Bryobacteraceae bacterium]
MNPNDPILSAESIREIAGRTAAANLPDEVAETLPVITAAGGSPRVRIVFYNETGPPNARKVHLPHHLIEIHPVTGNVLRFAKVRPREVGVADPPVRVPGVDYDDSLTVDEYIRIEDRFLAISPAVWRLFLDHANQPSANEESVKLVREYWDLFARSTPWEVAPFYIGAAPDFFSWVRATAGK